MRLILSIVILFCCCLPNAAFTSAGENAALYESLRCGTCHKPDTKAAAVSLAEIAGTYQTGDKLVKFMKGEAKPIVESDKWGLMRGQMSKLSALGDEEKEALADYILSFK